MFGYRICPVECVCHVKCVSSFEYRSHVECVSSFGYRICHDIRIPNVFLYLDYKICHVECVSLFGYTYRIAGKFGGNYIWRNGLQAAKN